MPSLATASSVFAVLKATLDSGERELRLIAAQDAFAHPACSSRSSRSADATPVGDGSATRRRR